MKKRVPSLMVIIFLIANVIVAGCGANSKEKTNNRLKIVTTLFPLCDITRNIAGDRADVTLILPPGVEPHSFEPKAKDILRINSADIFVYTGRYMEPWAENILKGVDNKNTEIIDVSNHIKLIEFNKHKHDNENRHIKHGHGDLDPHIWLDFSNVLTIVDNIVEGLSKKDPYNKDYYRKNGEMYKKRVVELDERFKSTLGTCKKRIIVHGGHFTFGYLARRYSLGYLSAYKGSPDAEPTPKHIAQLKKIIKEKGIKYIFFEELITPRVAEVMAKETGTQLLRLHGCHNVTKDELDSGVTFLSLMEENLKNLRKGLECQ